MPKSVPANSEETAKPTRGKPFQKGQSGNPSGRPKIPAEVVEAARALTPEAIRTLAEIMQDEEAPAAARVNAANSVLDRAWGKATQPMEMSGPGGGPVQTEEIKPARPPMTPHEWLKAHGVDLQEIADVGPATGTADQRAAS